MAHVVDGGRVWTTPVAGPKRRPAASTAASRSVGATVHEGHGVQFVSVLLRADMAAEFSETATLIVYETQLQAPFNIPQAQTVCHPHAPVQARAATNVCQAHTTATHSHALLLSHAPRPLALKNFHRAVVGVALEVLSCHNHTSQLFFVVEAVRERELTKEVGHVRLLE